MTPDAERTWRTAVHEAGHTVAGYLCGRRFEYVSIIADTSQIADTFGHVRFVKRATNAARELGLWVQTHGGGFCPYPFPHKPEIQPRADVRREAETEMFINLSGYAAEWVFIDSKDEEFDDYDGMTLQDDDGQGGDGWRASDIAKALTMDENECDAYFNLMRFRARNILSVPAYRSAVSMLAVELQKQKKLPYKQAATIIHGAIQACRHEIQRDPAAYFAKSFGNLNPLTFSD